jgi:hypothetical protein
MASNTNEVSLDKLVDRFEKAVAILKRKMPLQAIATLLDISPGFLSRYRKPQLYHLPPSAYHAAFEILDQIILNEFKQKWDKHLDEYELVSELKSSTSQNVADDERCSELTGGWQVSMFDKGKTKFSEESKDYPSGEYYYLFALNIAPDGEVTCSFEDNNMSGTISFVSPMTIAIDLSSRYRRLTMFAQVGIGDNLALTENITFTYTDTGNGDVRCGVAIAKKLDDETSLPPARTLISDEIPKYVLSDTEKDYLSGKQYIAGKWGFEI